MMISPCLACDTDEVTCLELGGCCTACDHRPEVDGEDLAGAALPGLDGDTVRLTWVKTSVGYQTHLSQLPYADGWGFWSATATDPALSRQRGQYRADEVDTVFLARRLENAPFALRKALIVIATGEVLASIDWEVEGRG